MEVTTVTIALVPEDRMDHNRRLQAYGSIVLDRSLVIQDMRIIVGNARQLFVQFPDRLRIELSMCGHRNAINHVFCSTCGQRLPKKDRSGENFHMDVVHPITTALRWSIHEAVLCAYENESRMSRQPGYHYPSACYSFETNGPPERHVITWEGNGERNEPVTTTVQSIESAQK